MANAVGDYESRILHGTCNLVTLLINDGLEASRIAGHNSSHAEVVRPFARSEDDGASAEAAIHVRIKVDFLDWTIERNRADESTLHKRKGQTQIDVFTISGPSKRKP